MIKTGVLASRKVYFGGTFSHAPSVETSSITVLAVDKRIKCDSPDQAADHRRVSDQKAARRNFNGSVVSRLQFAFIDDTVIARGGMLVFMRPDWRECPRGDVPAQWAALYVTMNPKGNIVMSRITYERLGAPNALLVLFDKVNNRIGLKPSAAGTRNAYPVGPCGRHGGKILRAYRLTREFGINLPETIRFYDAEIDQDGVLVLDLRTARVSERARTKAAR